MKKNQKKLRQNLQWGSALFGEIKKTPPPRYSVVEPPAAVGETFLSERGERQPRPGRDSKVCNRALLGPHSSIPGNGLL